MAELQRKKQKSVGTVCKDAIMTGISYMIPVIVGGGVITAIAKMMGGYNIGDTAAEMQTLAQVIFTIGNNLFAFAVPCLAAFIAYAIADKPGIAPGYAMGVLAGLMKTGFVGGLVGALIAGWFVLQMKKIKVPKALQGIMPIMFIPVLSTLIVPGLELKILDDDGHEVETGTVGTVYIRGANVVEYYYKMESPLFTEDGWLDTGDMGYQNEDAFVFFVDRKKDMVNRGGEKIWCTDVEDELIAFKGVKDAAVVGIPNEKYGEVAAAVVVLEKGAQLTEEQIKEEMLKEMARFKVPERILFLDAIPKTPGLKTDKKYIRTLFQ